MTPTSQLKQSDDGAVMFPEPEIVVIHRAGGTVEELQIMPLPFSKWPLAFRKIAEIAPFLGFRLDLTKEELAEWQADLDKAGQDFIDVLKANLGNALRSEAGQVVLEFLALAINKPLAYFDEIYAEGVDILAAVIKVNLNFFCLQVLPKMIHGLKSVTPMIAVLREQTAK